MNSAVAETITGVPTRYTSTTVGAADFYGGNFMFPETTTVLAATAHTWSANYTAATAGQVIPTIAGNASNSVGRLDLPINRWFFPLNGESGVRSVQSVTLNVAVATGASNIVIGHPIIFLPSVLANVVSSFDHLNTAFNLARVFPGACLSMLDVQKNATTAPTVNGSLLFVAG
jgi:hypothetical protein